MQVPGRDGVGHSIEQPQGDHDIEDAKQECGLDQAKVGNQQERKQQRGEQRADIVEGEHARDQVAELEAILEDAQQQRNLDADQYADQQDLAVEDDAERFDLREQQ